MGTPSAHPQCRSGYITLVDGRPRGIRLLRASLSHYSTSELLLELQARDQVVQIQPRDRMLPSIWAAPRTENEVTIPPELNEIP
jgi:hypothetical protein